MENEKVSLIHLSPPLQMAIVKRVCVGGLEVLLLDLQVSKFRGTKKSLQMFLLTTGVFFMTDDLDALQKDHGVLIFGFLPHGSDGIPVDKVHGERHRRLQSKNLGKTSRARHKTRIFFLSNIRQHQQYPLIFGARQRVMYLSCNRSALSSCHQSA